MSMNKNTIVKLNGEEYKLVNMYEGPISSSKLREDKMVYTQGKHPECLGVFPNQELALKAIAMYDLITDQEIEGCRIGVINEEDNSVSFEFDDIYDKVICEEKGLFLSKSYEDAVRKVGSILRLGKTPYIESHIYKLTPTIINFDELI